MSTIFCQKYWFQEDDKSELLTSCVIPSILPAHAHPHSYDTDLAGQHSFFAKKRKPSNSQPGIMFIAILVIY